MINNLDELLEVDRGGVSVNALPVFKSETGAVLALDELAILTSDTKLALLVLLELGVALLLSSLLSNNLDINDLVRHLATYTVKTNGNRIRQWALGRLDTRDSDLLNTASC